MDVGQEGLGSAREHEDRAESLDISASVLQLVLSRLKSYRITDSNVLDTGSITLSIREIFSAVGEWSVGGAKQEIELGVRAVREARHSELVRAKEAFAKSNGSGDDAPAEAIVSGIENDSLTGS